MERIRRVNESNREVLEAWDKARRELAAAERFAHSRYYTSSWFQLTGKPLERGEIGPLAPYRLISQYAKKDRYQLKASKKNNRVGRGLQAEWFVYSTLDERVHAEGLLQGARVSESVYRKWQRGRVAAGAIGELVWIAFWLPENARGAKAAFQPD